MINARRLPVAASPFDFSPGFCWSKVNLLSTAIMMHAPTMCLITLPVNQHAHRHTDGRSTYTMFIWRKMEQHENYL